MTEALIQASKRGESQSSSDSRRGVPGTAGAPSGLPCLYGNNSDSNIDREQDQEDIKRILFKNTKKKQAQALYENVLKLCKEYGSKRIGFLTLTTLKKVYDVKEINRMFNNLNRRIFPGLFVRWVKVLERHADGALHIHIVVVCHGEIGRNFNFEKIRARQYRAGSCKELRALWKLLRVHLPAYGFGRHELLPVRKNGEALARYVGGYLKKGWLNRTDNDAGQRMLSYSNGYAWNSHKRVKLGSTFYKWQAKCMLVQEELPFITELEDFGEYLGPHWFFIIGPFMDEIVLPRWFDDAPERWAHMDHTVRTIWVRQMWADSLEPVDLWLSRYALRRLVFSANKLMWDHAYESN